MSVSDERPADYDLAESWDPVAAAEADALADELPDEVADELADLDEFLRVSAELTGFDVPELRATGMADEHHRTALAHRVRDEHALVHLWYVGAWPGEAPSSARAHDQGLVWRTFRATPPGAAAPGHGSWAEAPRDGATRSGAALGGAPLGGAALGGEAR
ncbi:hypothetical protein ATKI12_4675 [Kitasatospora sp. Ki12]|uniref:hypothetical protein n=1 Tax=Kitasatospora xanthocidica TaxID=83382 RepID=UPI001679E919|nr:hypothetical protein [Kitasatospora xanthocidica]GHF60078.1 hypothetical protein GCM10018790_42500 [Kitasatospora xanthocidica]